MDPLARLEPFLGEWSLEARFPDAPPSDVVGAVSFEWELGGKYLVQRSAIPHPDAPGSLAIVSVSADGQAYTQHYFDSRGVTRLYAMSFDGRAWELLRDAPDFSPLQFSQRFTGTFSEDGSTIAGRWESGDGSGSGWQLDFELVYRRAP